MLLHFNMTLNHAHGNVEEIHELVEEDCWNANLLLEYFTDEVNGQIIQALGKGKNLEEKDKT